LGKYYIWFVVVVAGLAGLIRLLLPRRFAELQLERFKGANAISKAKMRSLLFLAVGVVFGGIYFLPWGQRNKLPGLNLKPPNGCAMGWRARRKRNAHAPITRR